MNSTRSSLRYKITKLRTCRFCLITFKDLAWKDHTSRVVDVSRHGVGIETEARLEPGFVWFLDRMGGFRGGVLMWSRKDGERQRAGIRFISLSRTEEAFVHEQVGLIRAHKPLTNPEGVVATIMQALTGASSIPAAPKRATDGKSGGDDPLRDIQDMVSKL